MDVHLNSELENFIRSKVTSGEYASPSEVVSDSLRLMRDQDEFRRIKLDNLRREIQVGIEAADQGRTRDAEAVMADLKQRLLERTIG